MELREYQKRIANFLLNNENVLLSVGMGLGKTAPVLHFLDYMMKINNYKGVRVLIVAPRLVAETVWRQEAEDWGLWNLRASMIFVEGTKVKKQQIANDDDVAQIKIVTPGSLYLFENKEFDILIIDESTKFKNWNAKCSKAIRSINATRKIGMTGTFTPNGIFDTYPQLAAIDIADKKKYYSWRSENFVNIMEGSGLSFQKWKLRQGVTVNEVLNPYKDKIFTMTTDDYLEIPDFVENKIKINLSLTERKAYDELVATLHFEIPENLEDFTTTEKAKFAKIQTLTSGFVYEEDGTTLRIEGGGSKIKYAVEFCCECRDNSEKVLIFYTYRESAIRFKEEADKEGLKVCSMSNPDWLKSWNNGEVDVLIANPAAAGHGLNLQKGGHVILWLELTYNYELFAQANARLHRSGQDEIVRIYYLIATETIDVRILSALKRKEEEIKEINNLTKDYNLKELEGCDKKRKE